MRVLNTFLAAALLLFATSATAYEIDMTTTYAGEALDIGDTVVIDVFLDADPGLQLLSVAVLYDPVEFDYDATASANLPLNPQVIGQPGASGAQPSYILYTGGKPATILYPQQSPAWLPWPAPPAGKGQVNINYAEASLSPAAASGTNIYIASMVFEITDLGDGAALIELCNTCGGNVLQSSGVILDPATIPLNGSPIAVTVPEPTVSIAGALVLVAVAGLRLRRRSS